MANEEFVGMLYAANKDRLAAEALLEDPATHCEAISFHAQQCAEKMLKAVYEENGRVAPKTHTLEDLLDSSIENGWLEAEPDDIRAAANLTRFSVVIRYSSSPEIDSGEALDAVLKCNLLANMLERNGYTAIHIESNAHYLHDEEARMIEQTES